jgi:chromosome segregation ATPase
MEEHNLSSPENAAAAPTAAASAAAHSAAALRELSERAQSALASTRDQAAQLEAEITRQLDEIAAALSEQTAGESQANASEAETLRAEIARLTGEMDNSRASWLAERTDLELQREELLHKLGSLESQHQSTQTEWRNQLLDFEARLREQQKSWNDQRAEWAAARTAIERERDEVQQKFDLALQDVQRLRARVAELEQDLSRRPESNQADSAELVALRAERDTLAARVAQLEERSAVQSDANSDQQLADLQRRFELAVEDVRDLKTKNAKLESRLAAAASNRPVSHADGGSMDWESQKRRLLAALEDGGEQAENISKQDRITIESTIEMTDAVVAEKDRQIAELEAQLAALNDPSANEDEHNRKVNELLDADEVIAQHRQKVRELEREMEEKLRTAELEISVERAKIARQKMELDELKSELESKRQQFETTGSLPVQGQPKRNWRSKLGLAGDE